MTRHVLVGRDAELQVIDEAIASARAGRGRAACFVGEAGIGKSTLLAAARERAGEIAVCAGSAWEAGGAPPYWPWRSVLRDAHARFGDTRAVAGADRVAAIAPEWGDATRGDDGDPAAARFALLDGVVRALVELSRREPLVVLLDDLHAADVPTLELLVLAVRELPRAAIALIAAWREGELVRRSDAARLLARAARHADVRPLRRLSADEVTRWIGDDGAAVHGSSDGNPLFVEEIVRARRAGTPARGLSAVLDDHLALVEPATRELLAAASVLGRDLAPGLLRAVTERDADALAGALREAELAGVVERRGDGWAFRHVLLRDHLYDAVAPSRRAALHGRVGEALARDGDAIGAAHHLLRGDDPARAIAAARAAASAATAMYAFEDAVVLLDGAQHIAGDADLDLRIELAEARHRAGQGDLARAECVRAAATARAAGDVARLARLALVYSAELSATGSDPQMIALLDEALAAFPDGDSPLRARLTARLAAAHAPLRDAATRERWHARARDAIAMARRLGDADTELYALRFASETYGQGVGARERLPIALDVVALATRLGRPLDAIDHRMWLTSAHLALGDRAAANAAADEVESVLAHVPQPHYRWRLPLLRARSALLRGDTADARRHYAAMRALIDEHDLDRARLAAMFVALSIAAIDGKGIAALVEDLRAGAGSLTVTRRCMIAYALSIAGRLDDARAELAAAPPMLPGIAIMQPGAEAIVRIGDPALAAGVLPVIAPVEQLYPIAVGPGGSLLLRPIALVVGELQILVGDRAAGMASLERGLALARAVGALPLIASAEAAIERARGSRPPPPAPHSAPADDDLAITCGEVVRVRWRGREHVVPAGKGFDYLAALVAAPGREVHVSDLVGDDDRGDAGEVLDAAARADYRARAVELQRDLDAARERNDLGRAERLAAELESITDQLLAASGLGGRSRRAGARVERARINVQRRIKDAIRRLANEDEALARYVEATIRTGTFCSYNPL